jgi:hypothetical protein
MGLTRHNHFESDQTLTRGTHMTNSTLTIRRASGSDAVALQDLATLDSAVAPGGDVLVAEVGSELWAAVEVESGAAVADPFRPTADLVELLRFRAEAIRSERRGERRRFGGMLPRLA